MKNRNFWRRLSNISGYGGGIMVIIHIFFIKYLEGYIKIILVLEAIIVVVFLSSELMKYLIRRKFNK